MLRSSSRSPPHANWISGHERKVAKLRRSGLWATGRGSGICAAAMAAGSGTSAAGGSSLARVATWAKDYATHKVGGRELEVFVEELAI